jgi:hypothetical protein
VWKLFLEEQRTKKMKDEKADNFDSAECGEDRPEMLTDSKSVLS